MLLAFPTFENVPIKRDDEITYLRSLDKDKFNKMLVDKIVDGWVVYEMTSSFRKTKFGGSLAYYAELRRGDARKKKE